ncbi:hypothetical protein CM19_00170 [Candidatus Acidianus copahuensis]|uniref:Uncharacterized protein n=1 Tax=Candidatus Acidianus copahuensis TaxID=1160895 RepID=A0A031LX53_9CREN|nr:hypothetical protein [Candidatus Acidianus copahuensis]EZQ12054.1 hypothetical protein CM19_00170 [Candidatus Acidianus copahuensis]
MKDEAEIKKSLEMARRLFYIKEIDLVRWLLDVYGVFALAIFISTYLLSLFLPRLEVLGIGLLVVSTIDVIETISGLSSPKFADFRKLDPKSISLTIKISIFGLIISYFLFIFHYFFYPLLYLQFILTGVFIELSFSYPIYHMLRKLNEKDHFLIASYVIMGVCVALTPFNYISLLAIPTVTLLYEILRKGEP